MDRVEHDLTDQQWAALRSAWGGCAYCGAADIPMQRDCVLAISRGGRYTLDNVVPACRTCNTSKCNDEVTGWLRRKRLDERAFLLRHLQIRIDLAQQLAAVRDAADPAELAMSDAADPRGAGHLVPVPRITEDGVDLAAGEDAGRAAAFTTDDGDRSIA
jgi:hypothetical protein